MSDLSQTPAVFPAGLSETALRGFLGESADRFRTELYDVVSSTNDIAKTLGMEGAPGFTAVLADRQESGRGRLARAFFSPPGMGMYLSILLRPTLPAAVCAAITPLAAVAVCRALEATFPGIQPGIKWVNDIYLGEKKLCGILTESSVSADGGLSYAVLGIGVNAGRTDFPESLAAIATSLGNEGYGVDELHLRERIAAAILRELLSFEEWLTVRRDDLYAAYRARMFLLGRRLAVYGADGSFLYEGYAEELEEDFSLRFVDDAGERHLLTAGEVSLKVKSI